MGIFSRGDSRGRISPNYTQRGLKYYTLNALITRLSHLYYNYINYITYITYKDEIEGILTRCIWQMYSVSRDCRGTRSVCAVRPVHCYRGGLMVLCKGRCNTNYMSTTRNSRGKFTYPQRMRNPLTTVMQSLLTCKVTAVYTKSRRGPMVACLPCTTAACVRVPLKPMIFTPDAIQTKTVELSTQKDSIIQSKL